MLMLTEVCQELRNWFDRGMPKYFGRFTVADGRVTAEGQELEIADGQYYRVVGSVFNDGVHKQGDVTDSINETFVGSVWAMAVPPTVIALVADIEAWVAKYGGVDSQAMSPFNSESFGGYSYSKSGGGSASGGGAVGGASWASVFSERLNRWRKI